jgi:hypothetical protein
MNTNASVIPTPSHSMVRVIPRASPIGARARLIPPSLGRETIAGALSTCGTVAIST